MTTLAAQLVLGTFVIDRFVIAIFPKERQLVPQHSKLIAIVTSFMGALTVQTDAAG